VNQPRALPDRTEEDYRYADLVALTPLWPVSTEQMVLGPGEQRTMTIVLGAADDPNANTPLARELLIELEAGASLALHLLNLGAGYGRFALKVTLGAGARFSFGAVQLAFASQTLEVVTRIVHAAPQAFSRQVVRSVAGGQATINYLGKVVVARGADGADGAQSIRAMLLGRGASANARPELEIHADDVRCAHGCAVGELDPEALFYLAQRGLPPETARRLMLQAFVAEAFAEAGVAEGEALLAQTMVALEAMP